MIRIAELPTSTPEAQGISSAAIAAFIDAVEREESVLHSLILVRHGHKIASGWWEPYGPEYQHMLFSLSKSFTSSAIGMLVEEGRLSVEDKVVSFFPEETPADPSANLQAMTIHHLLSMSTGHADEPMAASFANRAMTWVEAFLIHPVPHKPGTHFLYNSAATYMLSAIAQKVTGQRLLDYLQPRLFEPLDIKNPRWEQSPEGIDTGGWGLNITTDDIAKFGQLYLQKGEWQGQRLISEAWIERATSKQISNGSSPESDWEQGYGYQFWRCRHDGYRGDGAFGQYCVVLPEQDTVIAITSGLFDMQQVLNLVWKHLLPALESDALTEDSAAQQALQARLEQLRLKTPQGQAPATLATEVSGKLFKLETNPVQIESVEYDFAADGGANMTIHNEYGAQAINVGAGEWLRGSLRLARPAAGRIVDTDEKVEAQRFAAAGAWRDDQIYVAQLWWYETPFAWTLTISFDGDKVLITQEQNVAFGEVKPLEIVGHTA